MIHPPSRYGSFPIAIADSYESPLTEIGDCDYEDDITAFSLDAPYTPPTSATDVQDIPPQLELSPPTVQCSNSSFASTATLPVCTTAVFSGAVPPVNGAAFSSAEALPVRACAAPVSPRSDALKEKTRLRHLRLQHNRRIRYLAPSPAPNVERPKKKRKKNPAILGRVYASAEAISAPPSFVLEGVSRTANGYLGKPHVTSDSVDQPTLAYIKQIGFDIVAWNGKQVFILVRVLELL